MLYYDNRLVGVVFRGDNDTNFINYGHLYDSSNTYKDNNGIVSNLDIFGYGCSYGGYDWATTGLHFVWKIKQVTNKNSAKVFIVQSYTNTLNKFETDFPDNKYTYLILDKTTVIFHFGSNQFKSISDISFSHNISNIFDQDYLDIYIGVKKYIPCGSNFKFDHYFVINGNEFTRPDSDTWNFQLVPVKAINSTSSSVYYGFQTKNIKLHTIEAFHAESGVGKYTVSLPSGITESNLNHKDIFLMSPALYHLHYNKGFHNHTRSGLKSTSASYVTTSNFDSIAYFPDTNMSSSKSSLGTFSCLPNGAAYIPVKGTASYYSNILGGSDFLIALGGTFYNDEDKSCNVAHFNLFSGAVRKDDGIIEDPVLRLSCEIDRSQHTFFIRAIGDQFPINASESTTPIYFNPCKPNDFYFAIYYNHDESSITVKSRLLSSEPVRSTTVETTTETQTVGTTYTEYDDHIIQKIITKSDNVYTITTHNTKYMKEENIIATLTDVRWDTLTNCFYQFGQEDLRFFDPVGLQELITAIKQETDKKVKDNLNSQLTAIKQYCSAGISDFFVCAPVSRFTAIKIFFSRTGDASDSIDTLSTLQNDEEDVYIDYTPHFEDFSKKKIELYEVTSKKDELQPFKNIKIDLQYDSSCLRVESDSSIESLYKITTLKEGEHIITANYHSTVGYISDYSAQLIFKVKKVPSFSCAYSEEDFLTITDMGGGAVSCSSSPEKQFSFFLTTNMSSPPEHTVTGTEEKLTADYITFSFEDIAESENGLYRQRREDTRL